MQDCSDKLSNALSLLPIVLIRSAFAISGKIPKTSKFEMPKSY